MNRSDVPERWQLDAGAADLATLDIPPALRPRDFQVDVHVVVRCPRDTPEDGADGPWHELAVEFDGRREWSRRIPTNNPGQTDGLEFQRRVRVPEGSGLRVRALARSRGAQPLSLRIEAVEQAD